MGGKRKKHKPKYKPKSGPKEMPPIHPIQQSEPPLVVFISSLIDRPISLLIKNCSVRKAASVYADLCQRTMK